MNKNKHFLIYILILVLAFSCKNGEKGTLPDTLIEDMELNVDAESLSVSYNNKSYCMPSPHQASLLIKKYNIKFNGAFINPAVNFPKYVTLLKQALNLGVYGTDLGYLNIYDQVDEAINYFDIIKKLSNELNILNTLDINTLKKIEKNISNSDSLIYYLSITYKDIDKYLQENNRNDVGALIIAGGWIEGMYLISQYFIIENDPKLYSFLSEQKYPLNNLIDILSPHYNQSEQYSTLIDNLVDLAYVFDAIDFKYHYNIKQTASDKKLTIIDAESNIETFDDTLNKISKKVTLIRNNIIE